MIKFVLFNEKDLREIKAEILAEIAKTETPKVKEEDKLLTTDEACEYLRCSKPTIHRWKKEGIIPHVRIGVNIRYRLSDLKEIIEKGK